MNTKDKTETKPLLIQCYRSANEGRAEMTASLEDLLMEARDLGIKTALWRSDSGVRYFDWPGFLDLAALVTSTSAGVGLYNLLRVWLDSKNGRRIRVKLGEVELEATQLSKSEFMQLLDTVLAKQSHGKPNLPAPTPQAPSEKARLSRDRSTFQSELTLQDFLALAEQVTSPEPTDTTVQKPANATRPVNSKANES